MEVLVNYDYREEDVNAIDFERLFTLVMEEEDMPESSEASINFVNNNTIRELNNEYRGVDLVTDVLTFALADDGELIGEEEDAFELGDIIVAVDVAESQAKEFGTSFEEEVCLLVTHGLLHLCGYDHMEDDEAEEMESRERALLTEYLGHPFTR